MYTGGDRAFEKPFSLTGNSAEVEAKVVYIFKIIMIKDFGPFLLGKKRLWVKWR